MRYLFNTEGMAELKAFVDSTTLFAFDLDGTLAPIVDDPAGIAIPAELSRWLQQLNDMTTVAVITGRSCADAMTHLGFTPRFVVGNHGAEGVPGMETAGQDYACLCEEWKSQLETLLPDMAARGISLEGKGKSIALHYRKATDPVETQKCILGAISCLTPSPRVVSGIYVENIAPLDSPHKGNALEALLTHLGYGRAIFVGDDKTDEDVFCLHNPDIMGIRVGKDLESAASFYLKGQDEMIRLLREMIIILRK